MRTLKYIIMAACLYATPAEAQDMAGVLAQVERNNKELQAIRQQQEATVAEWKTRNNLEDPSVEYSPFFRSGYSGVASSELVVSQGFDFPTLYAARNKSTRLQEQASSMAYRSARRDILLTAKELCLDLVYAHQARKLVDQRQQNGEELLRMVNKRMEEGDATILEVNKVKMDLMNIRKERAQVEADRQTALHALTALNGNLPIDFEAQEYPATALATNDEELRRILEADCDLQAAAANEQVYAQEVKVNQQGWLPKLEVGYRRNTETGEASNGFLVGMSFPIFSNRGKVKVAKAQYATAQLQTENARIAAESKLRAQVAELQSLGNTLQSYDVPLMQETLRLLRKAVDSGELSVITYYTEADAIYENLHTYLDVNRQYQGAMAAILKNDL